MYYISNKFLNFLCHKNKSHTCCFPISWSLLFSLFYVTYFISLLFSGLHNCLFFTLFGHDVKVILLHVTKNRYFALVSDDFQETHHFHFYFLFLKKTFVGHESFLLSHWYPCFGLLVTSAKGFKARVDFSLAHFLACALFLRLTSGATPADCIEVSTAAVTFLACFISTLKRIESSFPKI